MQLSSKFKRGIKLKELTFSEHIKKVKTAGTITGKETRRTGQDSSRPEDGSLFLDRNL